MRPYMTEEEARTKWCPMVRTADDNRSINQEPQPKWNCCIGSGCMWWGWEEDKPECDRGRCEASGSGG